MNLDIGTKYEQSLDLDFRKKDGVFYTSKNIADYIVKNTLGIICSNKKIELKIDNKFVDKNKLETYKNWLLNLKILDPACGSGIFLIAVFDFLISEYKLSVNFSDEKLILKNNIFGVDINSQSVKITKQVLIEKCDQFLDLSENIKCGNSLISDKKISEKAFHWETEFKEIMDGGGFDIVVGNPPYIFARNMNFTETQKKYFTKNYDLTNYQINTYALFTELSINLLKKESYLGFIIPSNWFTVGSFLDLRKLILFETGNLKIVNLGVKTFKDASVETCILICKNKFTDEIEICKPKSGEFYTENIINKNIIKAPYYIIDTNNFASKEKNDLLYKINKISKPISDFAKVTTGLKAYQTGKGNPKQTNEIKEKRVFHSQEPKNETYIKYLKGKDVERYGLNWSQEYLSYGDWLAEPRKSVDFDKPRILVRQIPSKLPYAIKAVYTNEHFLNDINSMVIIKINNCNPFYMLAFLNSKLVSFWFANTYGKLQRKIFPQFKVKELSKFPIFIKNKEVEIKITELAEKNIELHKSINFHLYLFEKRIKSELKVEKTTKKLIQFYKYNFKSLKRELRRQKISIPLKKQAEWIEYFDDAKIKTTNLDNITKQINNEIDKIIYKLYKLTKAEIKIIEGTGIFHINQK